MTTVLQCEPIARVFGSELKPGLSTTDSIAYVYRLQQY